MGDETPDVSPEALQGAWEATQQLLRERKISAGHDISDGGLVTTVLEMAFAGNCGVQVQHRSQHRPVCMPSPPSVLRRPSHAAGCRMDPKP